MCRWPAYTHRPAILRSSSEDRDKALLWLRTPVVAVRVAAVKVVAGTMAEAVAAVTMCISTHLNTH